MKIRFGIVGCGFLGNIIANAWKDGFLEDYELVGVTSRTQESRDKTAGKPDADPVGILQNCSP